MGDKPAACFSFLMPRLGKAILNCGTAMWAARVAMTLVPFRMPARDAQALVAASPREQVELRRHLAVAL